MGFIAVFAGGALAALVVATLQGSLVGRGAFPLPPLDRRVGCIDGLRGYLALAVMIHHFFVWTRIARMGVLWEKPPINFLNQLGEGGVTLFFMTTGLVFYPRILRGFQRTDWFAVYITRAFRILPLVTVSFCIVTIIIVLRTNVLPDRHFIVAALKWITGRSEPSLMGYPNAGRINAYVLWSLWLEWLFYISVLPLSAVAMDIIRRYGLPTWIVPMIWLAISPIGSFVHSKTGISPALFDYLPFFAVGMLAYELQARSAIRMILSKPIMAVPAISLLIVAMISTQVPNDYTLPLFALFFTCVACGNSLWGVLTTKGALILGECSFGIYLLHGIVLNVLFVDLKMAFWKVETTEIPTLLPFVAFIVVLLTPATYILIELPAMRLGKVFATWFVGHRLRFSSREMEVAP